MNKALNTILARIMPFVGLAVFIIVFVIGLIFFSYLLIIGAIIGLALFLIGYIRARFFMRKARQSAKQQQDLHHGRTIEHDDQ